MSTPDPIDICVGENIRARRRFLNLSQTHLADSLGITFQQIQKYENAKNRVSASRLYYIADHLKAPLDSFFQPHEFTAYKDDKILEVLLRRWSRLTPEQHRLILEFSAIL